jgi:hypothetical protein
MVLSAGLVGPTMPAAGLAVSTELPALVAHTFAVEGTNIGDVPSDAEYLGFVGSVINGVGLDSDPSEIVEYPASFWPVSKGGLSDPTWNRSVSSGVDALTTAIAESGESDVLIVGQSQGAVVASRYKAANPAPDQTTTYVLISNPSRPNGGILERFSGLRIPILDVTFTGATPDVGGTTYDVGRQYDGWSDFPKYPSNLLATLNAIAGTIFLHGVKAQEAEVNFADLSDSSKVDIVVDGDTTYYTIPTDRLPILRIFEGFVPSPILTALDAPLRVMVEWGYDRQTSPGAPTGISLLRIANPLQDAANLATAVRVGIDDGLAEAAGDPHHRPLGTQPAGMYGVGGREISPSLPSAAVAAPQNAPSKAVKSIEPQVKAAAAPASSEQSDGAKKDAKTGRPTARHAPRSTRMAG